MADLAGQVEKVGEAINFWTLVNNLLLVIAALAAVGFVVAATRLSQLNRQYGILTGSQIANANEQADRARSDAAQANERAEALRKENLELQDYLTERVLDESKVDLEALKKYAGMRVHTSVADYKAWKLGNQLERIFNKIGWRNLGSGAVSFPPRDGVTIVLDKKYPSEEDRMFVSKAAKALEQLLRANGIESRTAMEDFGRLEAREMGLIIGPEPYRPKAAPKNPL